MAGTTLGTAYVQIVPSAQGIKGSIQNVLDPESKNAGQSAGANIVSFVKKALIGGTIGKVLKDTIMEGARYEQAIGGIETLFGKSADRMKTYAQEAYKTAGVSANEYMEQATSFASRLLRDTGGDTKKTAELVDLAIKDMADNANKMGTNIQDIQNAYQGLAKGNATMLDNLKIGYGGTQAEALQLAKDTGVVDQSVKSFNDMSFEDAILAIHKLQEELGITGTTALEAEDTISGSFASMKAAASNFMAQLVAGDNLSGAMEGVFESVIIFGKNLLKALGNVLINLPDALGHLGEMIMQKIHSIGDDPSIGIAAGEFIKKFALGIIANLPNILGAILTLAGYIGNTLAQALGNVFTSGASWIAKKFGAIWQAIQARATSAIAALRARFATVISAITKPFQTAFNTVKGIIDRIRGFFPIRVGNLLSGLKLPHFSISGKFSLNPPSVPELSISWYAKGGIVPSTTLIGAGEAGPEAILPLDPFWKKMDEIANNTQGGNTVNIYVNGANKDPKEIAEEVKRVLIREVNNRRLAWQ